MNADSIRLECPCCKKRLRIAAHAAGKRVLCPNCRKPVLVLQQFEMKGAALRAYRALLRNPSINKELIVECKLLAGDYESDKKGTRLDVMMRQQAAQKIRALGQKAIASIPILLAVAADTDEWQQLRQEVLATLEEFGSAAKKEAAGPLRQLLADADAAVGRCAAQALAKIDPEAPEQTKTCPSCQIMLPVFAVVCVDCGFDLRSGKKLSSTEAGASGRGGKRKSPLRLEQVRERVQSMGCAPSTFLVLLSSRAKGAKSFEWCARDRNVLRWAAFPTFLDACAWATASAQVLAAGVADEIIWDAQLVGSGAGESLRCSQVVHLLFNKPHFYPCPNAPVKQLMRLTKQRSLPGAEFSFGDTDETLADRAESFCIKIELRHGNPNMYLMHQLVEFEHTSGVSVVRNLESAAARGSYVAFGRIDNDGNFVAADGFRDFYNACADETNWNERSEPIVDG